MAVVVGGAVTYQAVSDKNTTGAASPKAAVQTIITDLNNSDLIGVLDDLAPGERAALANPAWTPINDLKRLHVLQQTADPSSVSGVQFKAQDLTFASQTITVNDHVQIVQLTGGTITIGSDLTKVPFTGDFLKAAFPNGTPAGASKQKTVNLADQVKADGPDPAGGAEGRRALVPEPGVHRRRQRRARRRPDLDIAPTTSRPSAPARPRLRSRASSTRR